MNVHDVCYQDSNGEWVVPESYAIELENRIDQLEETLSKVAARGNDTYMHLTYLNQELTVFAKEIEQERYSAPILVAEELRRIIGES